MASAAEKLRYTPEQYLALERQAEFRSEYLDGQIFAMAGTSRQHSLIIVNLSRVLSTQFSNRPCEVHTTEIRVRVAPTGLYTYPDVVALCGEPQFLDHEFDTLLNPTVIIEVLSPSTEAYDRGLKFAQYRRLDSLREYVLVAQDRVQVERYTRQGDEWVLKVWNGREDELRLESIHCTVPLREIYAKTRQVEADAPGAA